MRKLWNNILKESIESDTPVSVVRAGSAECNVLYNHKFKNIYVKNPQKFIDIQNRLSFEAGVYASNIKSLDKWCELYLDAMANSDYACAGLLSKNKRHLALMPHPERSFLKYQIPYSNIPLKTHYSPWFSLFVNIKNNL